MNNNPMQTTKKGAKAIGRAGSQRLPPQAMLISNGNPNAILDAFANGRLCDRRNSLPGQCGQYLQEILRHPELYHLAEQSRRSSYVNQPTGLPRDTTNQAIRHPKYFSTQHLNYAQGAKQVTCPRPAAEAGYGDCGNGNLRRNYFSTQHLDHGQARHDGRQSQAAGFMPGDAMNRDRLKNFPTTQHLNQVGLQDMPAPSPLKRARLCLKLSNLPRKFTRKDVIQKILGTDKMLVAWDGKLDISLKVERDGSLSCIAQFINEKEADLIRKVWNGTEIVKGEGKLIVEYLEPS